MKKAISLALFALSTAFIAGCGTAPMTPEGQARGIPEDYIVVKDLAQKRPGAVEVVAIRQAAMLYGIASRFPLFVDNKPVAYLANGEKVSLWLAPGKLYVIGTGVNQNFYMAHKGEQNTLSSDVEVTPDPARRYTVRVDYTGDRAALSVSSVLVN